MPRPWLRPCMPMVQCADWRNRYASIFADLTGYDITGRDAQMLERANITLNKNSVPNDPLSPMVTSGIRIGTPAVTSRGMKEAQMIEIANVMQSIPGKGV